MTNTNRINYTKPAKARRSVTLLPGQTVQLTGLAAGRVTTEPVRSANPTISYRKAAR